MKTCGMCLGESCEFLDLGKQPMANKYPLEDGFASEKFFPVKVFFCPHCKHIQLGTQVSREVMFTDYYYLSSVNKALVEHYTNFAHTLKDAEFVVDIGSNDGISLKPLKEMGVRALGVDPSVNVGKMANDAGYETLVSFFDTQTAEKIASEYGKADVITGFSMFSHLEDQHQFIEDVKRMMTDDGKLVIEVEYNRLMLEKMAFERFYLDRISYFSVTSFEKLFQKHGMFVTNAEVTDIHGGSLRVTAQRLHRGFVRSSNVELLMEEEKTKLTLDVALQFGRDAKEHIDALRMKLLDYRLAGLRVAGYGCPARVSTITNFGDIGPNFIEYIVDDSPLKQYRYSPGKHIPIVTPERLGNPDVLIVFAHEYWDDIKKRVPPATYILPVPLKEL